MPKPIKQTNRKNQISLILIVERVARRSHLFWARTADKGDGLQRHDFSHLELSPQRGQILTYNGPPPRNAKKGADWSTDVRAGQYKPFREIPDDLFFDTIRLSPFYFGIGWVKINRVKKTVTNPKILKDILSASTTVKLAQDLTDTGLTESSLKALVIGYELTKWQQHCLEIGLDERTTQNFYKVYQWETVKAFEGNPFRILSYADSTDYRALWRCIQKAYPMRNKEANWSAIWTIFYDLNVQYRTSIPKPKLEKKLQDLLPSRERAQVTITGALRHGVLTLSNQEEICQLTTTKVFERTIVRELIRLNTPAAQSNTKIKSIAWPPLFNEIGERDDFSKDKSLPKLKSFESGQLLLVYGEAGTGKTYLSARILLKCLEAGWNLRVAAVSNIAVSRVREQLTPLLEKHKLPKNCVRYSSIARLLNETIVEEAPPFVLLLDEASMVGAGQALQILQKVRPQDRLIMVGDPRQVPPIGWGALFHSLESISKPQFNQIHLTDRKRQQGSGRCILDMIDQLEKEEALLDAAKGKENAIKIIDSKGVDSFSALETYIRTFAKDSESLSKLPPILCFCRSDVAHVNWKIRQIRAGLDSKLKLQLLRFGHAELRLGEPVINTVNREKVNLWNGSRGRIVESDKILHAEFQDEDGQMRQHLLDSGIERAYAVTVHRSQGEGHKEVIVYISDDVPKTLLHRGTLYTAITRAAEKLIIVGSSGQFDEGYSRLNKARETDFLELAFGEMNGP